MDHGAEPVFVADQIAIRRDPRSRDDADATVEPGWGMASIFQTPPRALQEDTVLRIQEARIARSHGEEVSVETIGILEDAFGPHVVRRS